MFPKQFDTPSKAVIYTVLIEVDTHFVHLRFAPRFIWYVNAVGTFQRMGLVPKLRPSNRAHFFWRTKHNFLKTITHNENMSTKRKAWFPPVEGHPLKKGRPNKSNCIKDAVELVSGSFCNHRSKFAMFSENFPAEIHNFWRQNFCFLHTFCTNKFFAGCRSQDST